MRKYCHGIYIYVYMDEAKPSTSTYNIIWYTMYNTHDLMNGMHIKFIA